MFQFKRMPFGLINAPATFQRLMNEIITSDLEPNVFSYVDDIVIVIKNFEDHLKYLYLVHDKINDANLTTSHGEFEFSCCEIKYLGLRVN